MVTVVAASMHLHTGYFSWLVYVVQVLSLLQLLMILRNTQYTSISIKTCRSSLQADRHSNNIKRSIYTIKKHAFHRLRRWCSGNMKPFQGLASGSIPERRKIFCKILAQFFLFFHKSNHTHSRLNEVSQTFVQAKFKGWKRNCCCLQHCS